MPIIKAINRLMHTIHKNIRKCPHYTQNCGLILRLSTKKVPLSLKGDLTIYDLLWISKSSPGLAFKFMPAR